MSTKAYPFYCPVQTKYTTCGVLLILIFPLYLLLLHNTYVRHHPTHMEKMSLQWCCNFHAASPIGTANDLKEQQSPANMSVTIDQLASSSKGHLSRQLLEWLCGEGASLIARLYSARTAAIRFYLTVPVVFGEPARPSRCHENSSGLCRDISCLVIPVLQVASGGLLASQESIGIDEYILLLLTILADGRAPNLFTFL